MTEIQGKHEEASGDSIRILLVEDHEVSRIGLRFFLDQKPDLTVVGEASNGKEAIEAAEQLEPDIILMDVGMPIMDGIEASREILSKENLTGKIIMLTSHDSEQDIFASLAAGASGYCLKDVNAERLVTAIRAVWAGDLWLDSQIASKVVRALPQAGGESGAAAATAGGARGQESLSKRELEVLQLIVDGFSNQAIADQLVISPETVKTHIRHIMEKMAVSDRTQAAVKALRQGLISPGT